MEIIIEIYMYLRDGIKEHFILKKDRKKFKKLNEINSDIQNMYAENQGLLETDKTIIDKVLSTDVTNSHDINELYLFLKNYLDKTQ
ncbi:hypothetical protein [Staphylococcus aureus]|uniref:hypothetical protein n=1 Tax=Staphylococcus aureus TaxID=1280 RepID=UPI00244BF46B|nr:hypothetical protein [Staphylococcus aureus]MDH2963341.1 hypothetical protein [Staphylococcus aureus]